MEFRVQSDNGVVMTQLARPRATAGSVCLLAPATNGFDSAMMAKSGFSFAAVDNPDVGTNPTLLIMLRRTDRQQQTMRKNGV